MAALTAGPARAALGTLHAVAAARRPAFNGGFDLRRCCQQLTSWHRTLHLYSASTFSARRQPGQTLVSLPTTRWLPYVPRTVPLSPRLAVLSMTTPAQPFHTSSRHSLRKTSSLTDKGEEDKPERESIFQRFKRMYKDYWYVLVPVHMVTSVVWFGSFYYASKSGLDVVGMLESWGFSQTITDKLRNSAAGHLAVAYALYKIATPARYTVTLGGTTYSIKYLSERGYIKPVPSRQEMRDMYEDRRDELREQSREWRQKYLQQRREWRQKYLRQRREWRRRYLQQRREWREKFQERRRNGWRRNKSD